MSYLHVKKSKLWLIWHNIWLKCGRPRDGAAADIMRRTRAAYHYAVRYFKQNNSDIVKQPFTMLYSKIEAEISGVK